LNGTKNVANHLKKADTIMAAVPQTVLVVLS